MSIPTRMEIAAARKAWHDAESKANAAFARLKAMEKLSDHATFMAGLAEYKEAAEAAREANQALHDMRMRCIRLTGGLPE